MIPRLFSSMALLVLIGLGGLLHAQQTPVFPTPGPMTPDENLISPFDGGQAAPAATPTFAPRKREKRGMYVKAGSSVYTSLEDARTLLRDFFIAGFNRLYIEARTPFGVAYASQFEDSLPFISPINSNPINAIRKPLRQRAELHAVLNAFMVYDSTGAGEDISDLTFSRLLSETFDKRKVTGNNFLVLDPGHPDTPQYLLATISEMNRLFAPDGYLLTGFQYPGNQWGYNPQAVDEFRSVVGGEGPPPADNPVWSAWRRDQLTQALATIREGVKNYGLETVLAVQIPIDGPPPDSWEEWINSETYSVHMQDWIGWCREGLIDEIVLEIHQRNRPTSTLLQEWVAFVNDNSYDAVPIISLAGERNFTQGLVTQYDTVRTLGINTILYHYERPTREFSPGFFESLPNLVFNKIFGRRLRPEPLTGQPENRNFTLMANPPPTVEFMATPSPRPRLRPDQRQVVIPTPSPVPTKTPQPTIALDTAVEREITLRSGVILKARILEASNTDLLIQSGGATPMRIPRSQIDRIEPPLP